MSLDVKYKSIICLNGELNQIPYSYLPIIAADGAYNKLIAKNIIPKLVVGDFDSIKNMDYSLTEFIKHADQNLCDFEKCILQVQKLNLGPSLIVGGFGLEPDHCFNNLTLLAKYSKSLSMTFYAHNSWTKFITTTFQFSGEVASKVSIMPFPEALVSSSGLKWELNRHKLSITSNTSARNEILNGEVRIEILEGSALIISESEI